MDPQLLLAQFAALDSRLDRIESRQDAMTSTLIQQQVILAEQQSILREHVRRSTANVDAALSIPPWRVSISSSTTYYLVSRATFSGGTATAFGSIRARRVR